MEIPQRPAPPNDASAADATNAATPKNKDKTGRNPWRPCAFALYTVYIAK